MDGLSAGRSPPRRKRKRKGQERSETVPDCWPLSVV